MKVKCHILMVLLAAAIVVAAAGEVIAHPTWGIAVDKSGNVYFSDLTTVWKIDAAGKLSVFRPKGEGHVHEISVDDDGKVRLHIDREPTPGRGLFLVSPAADGDGIAHPLIVAVARGQEHILHGVVAEVENARPGVLELPGHPALDRAVCQRAQRVPDGKRDITAGAV